MSAPSINNDQNENRSVRASSINSNRSSKKKKNNRKKKAKQWTYYVETLKSTIDCLYEICRREQSIAGCKEATMYLQNAEKDFQSLIEAINLELSFNKHANKVQGVAWQVRKSMSSPNHLLSDNGTPALIDVLPMSPMIINDITLTTKTDEQTNECWDMEEGWQLVRGRRRRSASSTGTSDALDTESRCSVDETTSKRTPSVYERLSANVSSCRKHSVYNRPTAPSNKTSSNRTFSAKLTCPKSAMDLPQTKASMAKMAYCRQRIWEKDIQPSLAEKLRANQKRERLQREAPITKCGLNFADPSAVRARAKEFNEKKKQMRQQCAYSEGHRRSLQSICENVEEDQDVVPSDPKPSGNHGSKSDSPRLVRAMSNITIDMAGDFEWGRMTEEEESLAIEEQSLNLEIEKAESELESIDAELARQVEEEAEQCEMTKDEGAIFFPTGKGQYSQMVKKLEEDFKTFCHESWSELVEKEFAGQYRIPGTAVERHEKLCSPSRRRCEKNDVEFSQKHEEKIRRAGEVREKRLSEKTQRLKELAQKREEVRIKRKDLTERKRAHLQMRMERAQENREKTLSQIIRKAKGDEQKVLEVLFINNLQEENKRFDLMVRDAGIEERKQSMADLRAKKIEEKVAKEQAAEERRRKAEQSRVNRLQELNEKKEARHLRVTRERSLAEKEKKDKRRMREQMGREAKLLASKNDVFNSWMSLCSTIEWEKLFSSKKAFRCRLCGDSNLSNVQSFAHALQDSCGGYLKHCEQVITTEYMAQHMESTVQLLSESLISEPPFEKVDHLESLTMSAQTLRSSFRGKICSAVPSKIVKDFISLITKPTSRKTEDTIVKSIERLLGELLVNSDKTQGAQDMGLLLQSHVGDLLHYIISWSINLRVLGKLVSLIIKIMESESFALKCFFSEQLNEMLRYVSSVQEVPPHSQQFCSMLKIVASCMKSISSVNLSSYGLDENAVLDRLQIFHFILADCCQSLKASINDRFDRSCMECLVEVVFASGNKLHDKILNRFHSDFYDMFVEVALLRAKSWGVYLEKNSDSKCRDEINLFICLLQKFFTLDSYKKELLKRPERIIRLFCILNCLVRYLFVKPESVLTFSLDEQCLQIFSIIEEFASFSWSNQLLCHLEWNNSSILTLLGNISVQYIAEPKYSKITIPAFIAMTKFSCSATTVFAKTISLAYIISYIKDLIKNSVNNEEDSNLITSLKESLAFYENGVQKVSKIV